MLAFYTLLLVVLCAIAGLLLLSQANQSVVPAAGPQVSAFVKLRNNYVLVYALMMGKSLSFWDRAKVDDHFDMSFSNQHREACINRLACLSVFVYAMLSASRKTVSTASVNP